MSTGLTQFLNQLAPGGLDGLDPPDEFDGIGPSPIEEPEQPDPDPPPEMDGNPPESDTSRPIVRPTDPINGGSVTTPGCHWYAQTYCDPETGEPQTSGCFCWPEDAGTPPKPEGWELSGPHDTQSGCAAAIADWSCKPPPPPPPSECPPGYRPSTPARQSATGADTGGDFIVVSYPAYGQGTPDGKVYGCVEKNQVPEGWSRECGPMAGDRCAAWAEHLNEHGGPAGSCAGWPGGSPNGNGKTCEPIPTESLKWYRIVCINDCYDIVKDVCAECLKPPKGRDNVCVFGPYDSETACKSKTLTICDLLECVGEPGVEGPTQPPPDTTTGGGGNDATPVDDVDLALATEMPEDIDTCPVL